MKLSLLITGQVRDEKSFAELCSSLASMGDQQPDAVFATWTDELIKARRISGGISRLKLDFVDCGSALPLNPTLNRNLKSFLAQYQQILIGSERFKRNPGHVLRIRADISRPELLPELLKTVEAAVSKQDALEKTIVVGAGSGCPYFLEDRIMVLSQRHRDRLTNFPFSHLFSYDVHNLFPEFLFYTIIAAPQPEILLFEHQYGAKSNHSELVKYRQSYFGSQYDEYVAAYLKDFEDNFVFLQDLVGGDSFSAIHGSIIPKSYELTNLTKFREKWLAEATLYNAQQSASSNLSDIHGTLKYKRSLLSLELKYAVGKNANLVNEYKRVLDYGCFQDRADELFGCSLFVVGRPKSAFKYLHPLFEKGGRGFEFMFYMTAAAKHAGKTGFLDVSIEEYLRTFPGDKRVITHVENLRAL